jgi:DNA processing protein
MPLYWIALNSIKGIGPVRIKHLLKKYGSPEKVFQLSSSVLGRTGLFTEDIIKEVHDPELLKQAEKQLDWAESRNIQIMTLGDKNYPPLLKEIFAPPPVLFIKGSTKSFSKHCIGVVGMRQLGTYGKNATEHIVQGLVNYNISIVSGLALGIDSVAHKACLDNGGTTIAVLGCGVDKVYPASNRRLAEQIEEKGAIISEFPLGTPPLPYNFPQRNRIISGLCAGVLVVEARKKSGSLITAHYAMQQGRDVYAVPGSIFNDRSNGTFNLIKSGAIPVRSAKDILESIEVVTHAYSSSKIMTKVVRISPELLNAEERAVMDVLSDEPLRMDQIAASANKDMTKLFTILLNLELKGAVKQVAGQKYARI